MTQLSPPNQDLILTPLGKKGRPLREWLTTFHLASVVLDPYTNESSWILNSAVRIMRHFSSSRVVKMTQKRFLDRWQTNF
jgi:hypothetical protein